MYENDLKQGPANGAVGNYYRPPTHRATDPLAIREGGLMDTISAQERLIDQLEETLRALRADIGHMLRPMPEPSGKEAISFGTGPVTSVATEKVMSNNARIMHLTNMANAIREGADI